jgi:oligosaccharide repeat unit polymerase
MAALFVLVSLTAGVLALRFQRRVLSPVVIYAAVWSLVVLVATAPGRGYLPLDPATWRLVVLASVAFLVGCALASRDRRPAGPAPTGPPDGPYDDARLDRAYRWALAALALSVCLDVARVLPLLSAAGGLSGILGGQGLGFREAQVSAAAEAATTSFAGGSLLLAIAGYVLFMGNLCLLWGGFYAACGHWGRAAAPLLLVALYSLLTLQRFAFVYSLLIFLFSYAYHRRLTPRHRHGSRRPLAILGLVCVLVVFIPLQLRGQAVDAGQRYDSVVDYFAGGLAGLNTTLVESVPAPGAQPGLGGYTLFGLASILERLGAPIAAPPNLLPYLSISQTRAVNNNVDTWLIYPYYDFGLVGVILVPLALGALATWADRRVLLRGSVAALGVACIAMTTIAMSFFGLSLIRDVRWLVLAAGAALVTPWLQRRPRPAPAGATASPRAGPGAAAPAPR